MRAHVVLSTLLAIGATCTVHTSNARADVSSWLSVGGGYGMKRNDATGSLDRAASTSFALGVGTDPLRSIVVGGILRSTTYFTVGTDLGLAARVATGGFARGQWGLALDAGAMLRTFGSGEYGRWPLSAMLIGGAPWGVQLAVGGELLKVGGNDASAAGFVALLEMDLLRFTVMRQGATDRYWENPAPAGGRATQAMGTGGAPRKNAKMGPLPGLLW